MVVCFALFYNQIRILNTSFVILITIIILLSYYYYSIIYQGTGNILHATLALADENIAGTYVLRSELIMYYIQSRLIMKRQELIGAEMKRQQAQTLATLNATNTAATISNGDEKDFTDTTTVSTTATPTASPMKIDTIPSPSAGELSLESSLVYCMVLCCLLCC